MSSSIVLWLIVAVLLFWCVGVYNRLMRMRARGFAAFGSLEKHLKTLDTLLQTQLRAGASPDAHKAAQLTPPPTDWAHLAHTVEALDAACKAARSAPLQVQALAELGRSIDAVALEWRRISSEPADLAGSPVPDEIRSQWEDASVRAQAAREALNQILQRYNEAIGEFPARLIVGILGFKPAGNL